MNHPYLIAAVASGLPVTASSFYNDETTPMNALIYDPET